MSGVTNPVEAGSSALPGSSNTNLVASRRPERGLGATNRASSVTAPGIFASTLNLNVKPRVIAMRNNWAEVMRSMGAPRMSMIRVTKPTGWRGGYKRKAPTGEHKCLSRAEMKRLLASW